MRSILVLLLAAAPLFAQEDKDTQIDWVGDWDQALEAAKQTDRPIMVCINSKDGEVANERAAGKIYKDKGFVALTRRFVMVVGSTLDHPGMFGHCKRFGRVTCKQHRDCEKRVRNTYADQLSHKNGEMISPQHVFFTSTGVFLRRREFELKQPDLMKMMRTVLEASSEMEGEEEEDGDPSNRPLSEQDKARLQTILQTKSRDERRAAVTALLATGKRAATTALIDLLSGTRKPAIKRDVVRGLGKAGAAAARESIEGMTTDEDELVRNFSVVALEELGLHASVPALLKRCKKERERYTRKNIYRALGVCGGPKADKDAAKALLSAISRDKQMMVRKHAAIAIKAYSATDESKKLVKTKLESLALREKSREVRGGIVYALAYIGDTGKTLAVFEKILAKLNDDYGKGWMRDAIKVLKKRGNWRMSRWLWTEDSADPAREVPDWRGRRGR